MYISQVKPIPLLLGAFLGLAPVYWTPWTGVVSTEVVKAGLIILVFLVGGLYVHSKRSIAFYRSPFIYLSFAVLLVITAFGVINGNLDEVIYREASIVLAFGFMWCCYVVLLHVELRHIARSYMLIFVMAYVLWFVYSALRPGENNPINSLLRVNETGFSGNRIQWSVSISMFLAWLLIGSKRALMFRIVVSILCIAGQIMVASRSGFVGTLIVFVALSVRNLRLKRVPLILAAAGGLMYFISSHLDELRLATGDFGSTNSINELSTGRLANYEKGLELISSHPLLGTGIGNGHVQTAMGYLMIHNIILRFAVEGGLFYAIALVILFIVALRCAWATFRGGSSFHSAAAVVVVIGVVISMVEPEVPLGSFYINAMWWFSLAVCIWYRHGSGNGRDWSGNEQVSVIERDHLLSG